MRRSPDSQPIRPDLTLDSRLKTLLPGPRSVELGRRRDNAVPRGVYSVSPIFLDRAGVGIQTGVVLDVDGNRLIDLGAGIAVNALGAAHPRVVEAISRQADKLLHTAAGISPYGSYINLAETVNRMVPGEDNRTAFFNSGAEAVENAVKIARKFTGRSEVVVLDTGFHGRTNQALAMTARNNPYKDGMGPYPAVHRAPGSYPIRDEGRSGVQAAQRTIDYIETFVGPDNVAALVVEPIAGEGGYIIPEKGYIPELVRWSQSKGIVFVADEVQTGFGRTGKWFGMQHEDANPNLMTLGKALGGGLPISAVTGQQDIMDSVQVGGLGGTFGGNPVAAEAASATLRTLYAVGAPNLARDIEAAAMPVLLDLTDDNPRIRQARGRGAMMALEFVDPRTSKPDAAMAKRVAEEAQQEGVIVLTAGMNGQVARLSPPLLIDEDVLTAGLQGLKNAVRRATIAA